MCTPLTEGLVSVTPASFQTPHYLLYHNSIDLGKFMDKFVFCAIFCLICQDVFVFIQWSLFQSLQRQTLSSQLGPVEDDGK